MSGSKKIWFLMGIMLVVGLALSTWLGVPAYRRFKETRAVEQATRFAQKGDNRSAMLSLRIALALNSSNVVAARMMCDLADQAQSPEALPWRRRVYELEPTLDNKIKFAACALRYEKPPFPIAAQALREISRAGETNSLYHLVASDLFLKLNRLAEAEKHLNAAAVLEPTNLVYQLNRATIRLQSQDTNTAAVARRELAALGADATVGAPALRSLAADAVLRRQNDEAQSYARQLLALPHPSFDDSVLNLTVLSEAKSGELAATLARVQQSAASNTVTVAQLISWMNTHGQSKAALDWLRKLPAATQNTLPVPVMESDCYLTLRNWAGLEARLSGQNWEDQEFLRQALLANALRKQGRNQVADVVWKQAVTAASARTEFIGVLFEVANSWGWQEETESLLWALVKRAPRDNWPLQTLMQQYGSNGNTAGLLRVYETLLERNPKSMPAKNNVAVISLLLDRDLDRATMFAQEVYEADKTNAVFLSTYAFALHAKGKSTQALKLMETLPETDLRRPDVATYYAVLLSATGDREKAQTYIATAEKAQMLPEERRLLEGARLKN